MNNELIFAVLAVLDLTFVLLVSRLDKSWLYGTIILNIFLVSIFGSKLVAIGGFVTNAGNVFYASVFFATQILVERFGKKEGLKSIFFGASFNIFFILATQFILRASSVSETQLVNQALNTVFNAAPRIALASLIAFVFAEYTNISIFDFIKTRQREMRPYVRLNCANIIGQLVDSVLFFSIAFYGLIPMPILIETALVGFVLKVGVGILSTPFFYASFLIGRGEEVMPREDIREVFSSKDRFIQLIVFCVSIVPLLILLVINPSQFSRNWIVYSFVVVVNLIFATVLSLAVVRLRKTTEVARENQEKLLATRMNAYREQTLVREKLEEQNKMLEDAKKATLNILEDLHIEKSKIDLAKVKDDAILESIGDGLIAVDTDRKIMLVNKVALEMFDWKREEISGKIITDFKLEDEKGVSVPLEERPTTKALLTENVVKAIHFFKRKDSSRFPIAITATPIKLNGKVIGLIEIVRDVSKEQQIDQAKSDFISLASHQLRTPLSIINWCVEMLQTKFLGRINEKQKKYLNEVYVGSQRMVLLVNSLLNVSRLDSGIFMIQPEPSDIVKLVQSEVKEQKVIMTRKKLKLITSCKENIPKFSVDPNLFRMVVQNILSNAVKYTPRGGTIEVSVYITKDLEPDLIIKISDTGCGIPQKQQNRIFSKLFRADNVAKTDTEGAGLGLYIAKSIVDNSGGNIWFDSKENEGTTFYITFPFTGMKKKAGTKILG